MLPLQAPIDHNTLRIKTKNSAESVIFAKENYLYWDKFLADQIANLRGCKIHTESSSVQLLLEAWGNSTNHQEDETFTHRHILEHHPIPDRHFEQISKLMVADFYSAKDFKM